MKDIYKHISVTLKKLRHERGWSLDKAAAETGVSKAMLGQIERQESSPTIATLWKITSGFNTSFSIFMETTSDLSRGFAVGAGHKHSFRATNEVIHVTSLFPYDAKLKSEIFIIDLMPHAEHLSPAHQAGVIEHVIPVNGPIEILLDGNWQKVGKGEGLRFTANQPHGYRNCSGKIMRFHLVMYYI